MWDPWTNRYIITIIAEENGSSLLIAASKTSNPQNLTTDWYKYKINVLHIDNGKNLVMDFEKMAVNNTDAVYITSFYQPSNVEIIKRNLLIYQ